MVSTLAKLVGQSNDVSVIHLVIFSGICTVRWVGLAMLGYMRS